MGQALETARRHYDAVRREDWEALVMLYHPEVEIDLSRSGMPDGRTYHGRDGLTLAWTTWRGAWDEYEFEIEELTELGDRVLALIQVQARSKGHGIDTDVRLGELITVRNGLIVHFVNFLDRDAALREAGLS